MGRVPTPAPSSPPTGSPQEKNPAHGERCMPAVRGDNMARRQPRPVGDLTGSEREGQEVWMPALHVLQSTLMRVSSSARRLVAVCGRW